MIPTTSEIRRRRVDLADAALDVLEAGGGGEPLLILHGFCGAKESFEEALPSLARRGWHTVVPDQRGHGSSDHPEGEGSYSFEKFVADALELVDTLGWDRLVLLGHSMGGLTAQRFALAHPERLEGLLLMDTSHRRPDLPQETVAAGRELVQTAGLRGLVDVLRDADGPLVTEAHRLLLVRRPGYQEELDSQTLACSAQMWLAMSREMFEARDLLEELRSVSVPTLVLVGEQDAPFLAPSRAMAEAMPNAELAVIPDAGHSPELEAPEAWFAAVSRFLDGLREPRVGD